MTKTRISLLVICFIVTFFDQPNWVTDNFWLKADFWDAIPFTFPYLGFILIYAALATGLFELSIRFIKKFA
jgi:hypothetical protein